MSERLWRWAIWSVWPAVFAADLSGSLIWLKVPIGCAAGSMVCVLIQRWRRAVRGSHV